MRRLFHGAEVVAIWLGEESYESSLAFNVISRIVALLKRSDSLGTNETQKVLQAKDLGLLGLPAMNDLAWKALDSLFWRPWFTLVWVIREIAVAKGAVVLCGHSQCQWIDLVKTADFITDNALTAIIRVDSRRVNKFSSLARRFSSGPPHILLELLSQARDSYATDDRDKIFAPLRIALDAQYDLLRPNYKKPLVDVYTTLTKHLIERDRTLDILNAVEDHQFRLKRDRRLDRLITNIEENELPSNSQLPSWVLDWEVHRPSSPLLLRPDFSSMRAAGSTFASCTFSTDGVRMTARGVAFDKVTHVGDSFLESMPATGSLFPELRHSLGKS